MEYRNKNRKILYIYIYIWIKRIWPVYHIITKEEEAPVKSRRKRKKGTKICEKKTTMANKIFEGNNKNINCDSNFVSPPIK